MEMEEVIKLETPEYGLLKGVRAPMSEVDAVARERVYAVSFLGIYDIAGVPHLTYRMQGRIVFAPLNGK